MLRQVETDAIQPKRKAILPALCQSEGALSRELIFLLPLVLLLAAVCNTLAGSRASGDLAGVSLNELQKQAIIDTLAKTKGNREKAAKILGIGERTLYRKIKEYNLYGTRCCILHARCHCKERSKPALSAAEGWQSLRILANHFHRHSERSRGI